MDIKEGMISIILPAYNREEYIEECIRSVWAQSYQNYEIVLVDDGSTDNTLSICRALAEKDERIRIIEGKHKGVSAARNLALDNAEGEFVFFLDSDDVIYPTLLEILVNGMKEHNAGIAGTRKVGVNQRNWHKAIEKISEQPQKGEIDVFSNEETVKELLETPNSPFIGAGGVMLRRDLIQDTRFSTDLIIGEDYYFNYLNIIKGTTSVILRQRWYYCRHHASNSLNNSSFTGAFSRFYRRVLVWKSEDELGRYHFSKIMKIEAAVLFMGYLRKYKTYSEDAKKLRVVMKEYKKEIYPALSFKIKVLCSLHLYVPAFLPLIVFASKFKNIISFGKSKAPSSNISNSN